MTKPTINWNEIWAAIDDARKASTNAQNFLARLERHDLTILPLQVRRTADLFGVGMVMKTEDGYGALDPTKFQITETIEEPR